MFVQVLHQQDVVHCIVLGQEALEQSIRVHVKVSSSSPRVSITKRYTVLPQIFYSFGSVVVISRCISLAIELVSRAIFVAKCFQLSLPTLLSLLHCPSVGVTKFGDPEIIHLFAIYRDRSPSCQSWDAVKLRR